MEHGLCIGGQLMTRKFTQAQFDAAASLLHRKMKPERLESARLHLVDGLTMKAAGAAVGRAEPYSRQVVDDACKIVVRAWQTYENLQAQGPIPSVPNGWERVTLVAPPALANEFRQRAAQALAELPAKPARRVTAVPVKKHQVAASTKTTPRGVKL